jgi:hypothetical protein
MRLHLFKVELEHSDMFIRGLDFKTQLIEYQIFDKEGKPMEPLKKDKFVLNKGEIIFDKNRYIASDFASHIASILNA